MGKSFDPGNGKVGMKRCAEHERGGEASSSSVVYSRRGRAVRVVRLNGDAAEVLREDVPSPISDLCEPLLSLRGSRALKFATRKKTVLQESRSIVSQSELTAALPSSPEFCERIASRNKIVQKETRRVVSHSELSTALPISLQFCKKSARKKKTVQKETRSVVSLSELPAALPIAPEFCEKVTKRKKIVQKATRSIVSLAELPAALPTSLEFCVEDRVTLSGATTSSEICDPSTASPEISPDELECQHCKSPSPFSRIMKCSQKDCPWSFHQSCAKKVRDCSWRKNGSLVCPQHVCHACRGARSGKLWRCEQCPIASHELCCPWPEEIVVSEDRPGWAVCWRHYYDERLSPQNSRSLHKQRTSDTKEVFNRLPIWDVVEDFTVSLLVVKKGIENEKAPPPYTHIRRNEFLIKKKRDDSDEGAKCSCGSDGAECGNDCDCRVQSMSCSKDCICKNVCTNKPYRKDKRLKLVKTDLCGWGAKAAETINKGEYVIEYIGEVIDDAMCEKRLWAMKGRGIRNFYMCEISKDFIIDATFKGNQSRYLNHSCQPNCRLEKWRVDGETRAGVFALRDISIGEPLTYNYKYVEFGPDVRCCCGAPNCRGAIGEKLQTMIDDMPKWGKKGRPLLPRKKRDSFVS